MSSEDDSARKAEIEYIMRATAPAISATKPCSRNITAC
jgi:hypothetical protein